MNKLSKEEFDELISRLTQAEGLKDLTLPRTRVPDGTVSERWQIDIKEDLRLFQQAQRVSNDPLLDAVNSPLPPREFAAARAMITRLTLTDARDGWLASLQGSTLPKTPTIKKTAVAALVWFLGSETQLHTVICTDLARWYQQMLDEGSSIPTLTNKQSYAGDKAAFSNGPWPPATSQRVTIRLPAMTRIRFGRSGPGRSSGSRPMTLTKSKPCASRGWQGSSRSRQWHPSR